MSDLFNSLPQSPVPPYADQAMADFDFPQAQPHETQDMQVDGEAAEPMQVEDAPTTETREEVPSEAPGVDSSEESSEEEEVPAPDAMVVTPSRSLRRDGERFQELKDLADVAVAEAARRETPKRRAVDSEEDDDDDDEAEEEVDDEATVLDSPSRARPMRAAAVAAMQEVKTQGDGDVVETTDAYVDAKHRHHSPAKLYMSQEAAGNEVLHRLKAVLNRSTEEREEVDESNRYSTGYNLFCCLTNTFLELVDYVCLPNGDKSQINKYIGSLWQALSDDDKAQWKALLPYYDRTLLLRQLHKKKKTKKSKRVKPNPEEGAAASASGGGGGSASSTPKTVMAAMAAMTVATPARPLVAMPWSPPAPVPEMARMVPMPVKARVVEPPYRLTPQISSLLSAVELDMAESSSSLGYDQVLNMLEDCDNPLDLLPRLSMDQRLVMAAISRALRPHRSQDEIALDAVKLFSFSTSKREQL